ncbi:response regulator transcription factor [Pseudemcibacter aquimaris]|uniref:response regulator transcription factor n=1 Tax=Pseudemcibacter aquimaris TaxID=2857064 RepID=UPI002011B852|nr:response regulator [Pseudemcibacter aquimaris]MCC3860753.1 response regulator [Pseudemcibacter aquimaris]WDU59571.1 response regulator [Pseudemcibacter aquimaris]
MSTILIVDDDDDTRSLIENRLGSIGYQIITANDGLDGLGKARHHKPDFILMDMFMPKMDGSDVTRELRMLGYTTPIIALTAAVKPADEKIALDAGCNAVIVKPIKDNFEEQIAAMIRAYS